MSGMIERVAQAIYEASGQPACGVERFDEHINKNEYLACANAAIRTVLEEQKAFRQKVAPPN